MTAFAVCWIIATILVARDPRLRCRHIGAL